MTTQVLIIVALLAVALVAGATLADRLLEPRRDPAGILPVVSMRTARRALARVKRLDMEYGPDQAAAVRHLTGVRTWARGEELHARNRARRIALAELAAGADAQLAALGMDITAQVGPEAVDRYRAHMRAAGLPGELVANADLVFRPGRQRRAS